LVAPLESTNYTVTGVNTDGNINCSMTQEILVEVVKPIQAVISPSANLCKGTKVKLNAGGSNTYRWEPGDGLDNVNIQSPIADPIASMIYTVTVSDGGFCAVTATVLVRVNPVPTVSAGPDMTYNMDEPMYLNAKGSGTLTWISGEEILCKDCPNSQILPIHSGCYVVQATNQYGCKAIDEVCIEVTKNYNLYIPNIFTPNGDGLNDVFLVYGTGIVQLEMFIFDRWGEQLFYSDSQLKGWNGEYNGEVAKNDSYVYKVIITTLDGKKHTKTGHVTILK